MNQELKNYAKLLKDNGFIVIAPEREDYNWFKFFRDGKFGEVSISSVRISNGYYSFGLPHKPNKETGTAFGIGNDAYFGNEGLTLENAMMCINSPIIPKWYRGNRETTKPYLTVEDFINHSSNKWCDYQVI